MNCCLRIFHAGLLESFRNRFQMFDFNTKKGNKTLQELQMLYSLTPWFWLVAMLGLRACLLAQSRTCNEVDATPYTIYIVNIHCQVTVIVMT